jgi:hypothetical protein
MFRIGCSRWQSLTAANVNDITEAAERLPIQRWVVYVFDKGYCDYNWRSRLNALSARFVTRFKYNAVLVVKHALSVPPGDSAIVLCGERVRLKHKSQGGGRRNDHERVLRRVRTCPCDGVHREIPQRSRAEAAPCKAADVLAAGSE